MPFETQVLSKLLRLTSHDEIRDAQLDFASSKARNTVSQGFFEVLKNTPADSMKRAEVVIAGLVQKLAGTALPPNVQPRPTGCSNCGYYDRNGNFSLVCYNCRSGSYLVT